MLEGSGMCELVGCMHVMHQARKCDNDSFDNRRE